MTHNIAMLARLLSRNMGSKLNNIADCIFQGQKIPDLIAQSFAFFRLNPSSLCKSAKAITKQPYSTTGDCTALAHKSSVIPGQASEFQRVPSLWFPHNLFDGLLGSSRHPAMGCILPAYYNRLPYSTYVTNRSKKLESLAWQRPQYKEAPISRLRNQTTLKSKASYTWTQWICNPTEHFGNSAASFAHSAPQPRERRKLRWMNDVITVEDSAVQPNRESTDMTARVVHRNCDDPEISTHFAEIEFMSPQQTPQKYCRDSAIVSLPKSLKMPSRGNLTIVATSSEEVDKIQKVILKDTNDRKHKIFLKPKQLTAANSLR